MLNTDDRSSAVDTPTQILAYPGPGHPAIGFLYDELEALDEPVDVQLFTLETAWKTNPDIVHVHWPEATIMASSLVRATVKVAVFLGTLSVLRRRGARVIWTCHNLAAHERRHRRLERILMRGFLARVDGVIHLSAQTAALAEEAFPSITSRPGLVSSLGTARVDPTRRRSRTDARERLGIDPDVSVVSTIGLIRPYKAVPALISAFPRHGEVVLLVAGVCTDDALRAEVESLAADRPEVVLRLGWLDDDEFDVAVSASDVVVLNYEHLHNSGIAVSAVAMERPIAAPLRGAIEDLRARAGTTWVYGIDAPIDAGQLESVMAWAKHVERVEVDLSPWEPRSIAQSTLDFYHRVLN